MDETQLFPRKIVFGEVDMTQGGRVDRNIFDELVVAMIDWKKYRYVSVGETSYGPNTSSYLWPCFCGIVGTFISNTASCTWSHISQDSETNAVIDIMLQIVVQFPFS